MAAVSKRLWSYTSAKNINRSSKGPDQRVKVLKNRKSPQECNKNVIKTHVVRQGSPACLWLVKRLFQEPVFDIVP
jgi:hypothetical protein